MEHHIYESFNNIIKDIHGKLSDFEYNVEIINNNISISYKSKDNYKIYKIYEFYMNKYIYKYKDKYWKFIIINVLQENNQMQIIVNINFMNNLTSYFKYINIYMIYMISSYIDITEIGKYCNYLNTWFNTCNSDLYKFSYRFRFRNIYNLIIYYVDYDTIKDWFDRYRELTREDTANINKLLTTYKSVHRVPEHIKFILDIYNFLKTNNINISKINKLYYSNPDLYNELLDKIKSSNIQRYDYISDKIN